MKAEKETETGGDANVELKSQKTSPVKKRIIDGKEKLYIQK